MVRSASSVTPRSVTVEALRSAREFKALAAVALAGAPSEALAARRALLVSADHHEALAWLLAVNRTDSDWAALADVPRRVRVPDQLAARVSSFAKMASASPGGHSAAALSLLLPRIEPATLRRELARNILRSRSDSTMAAAARHCLSGSTDAADRRALLADALDQPVTTRLVRLDALGAFRSLREKDETKRALRELRDTGAAGGDPSVVGRLCRRLPVEWAAEWYRDAWPSGRAVVCHADFGRELGAQPLLAILSASVRPDVVSAVCEAAIGLDWADAAEVVARAVGTGHELDASTIARFLEHGGRPLVRPESWTILLAEHGERHAAAFAAAATLEDLLEAARSHASDSRAVDRFGRVLGAKATEGAVDGEAHGWVVPAPEWVSAVLKVVSVLGGSVLERLADVLPPRLAIPTELAAAVLGHDDAAKRFADDGFTRQLVAETHSPFQAEAILRTASDLTKEEVSALLGAVGVEDLPRWTRALGHVARVNPEWVHGHAFQIVDPLGAGVEEHMAPSEVVVATVQAALDAGLAGTGADTLRILTLLNHPDDAVVAVGASWAALSEVPHNAAELVNGIVEADEARDPRHPRLVALRRSLATHLCGLASSRESAAEKRVEYLTLAQAASPGDARDTAFTLATSRVALLAVAAADILATTNGQPTDAERLGALIQKERRREVRTRLVQALRMLTAGDAVAAIEGILAMAAVPFDPSVIAATPLARDADAEERLVACARLVLGSANAAAQVEDFIVNATKLADELMESAIVASGLAGTEVLSAAQREKIRVLAPDRITAGKLAVNQAVLERFTWVAHVATLHSDRPGHAVKRGSTTPETYSEHDRARVKSQLGRVVDGWLADIAAIDRSAKAALADARG